MKFECFSFFKIQVSSNCQQFLDQLVLAIQCYIKGVKSLPMTWLPSLICLFYNFFNEIKIKYRVILGDQEVSWSFGHNFCWPLTAITWTFRQSQICGHLQQWLSQMRIKWELNCKILGTDAKRRKSDPKFQFMAWNVIILLHWLLRHRISNSKQLSDEFLFISIKSQEKTRKYQA